MPKIPQYTRQQSLTTQSPNIERNAASFGAVSGAQAQLGNTIAQAGASVADTANDMYAKFEQAKNYHEELASDVNLVNSISSITDKAQQDPNIEKNLQQYDNELNTGLNESLKGISDPTTRDKALLQGKVKLATVSASLRDLARKNIGEKTIVDAQTMIKLNVDKFAQTNDKTFLADAIDQIDTLQNGGFLSPEKAYALKVKTTDSARDASFSYDLQNNPAEAGKKLDNNAYGFDVEKLGRAKDQYDREMKKVRNVNEEGVLDSYLNGNLKVEDVKALRDQGKVDAKFAISMTDKLKKGNSYKTDPTKYMEAVDVLLSPNMTAKGKRDYLMELLNTQQISDSDFKSLYRNGISGGASLATMYMAEKMTEDEKLQNESKTPSDINWLRSAVNTIKNSDALVGELDRPATIMKLFDSISAENLQGKNITEKAKSLIKDIIVAKFPAVGLMKDLPNKIYNGSEVKTVYAGDNELKPTKQFEPDKKDKEIGDEIKVGNVNYRVVGFDEDGEPLVESE